MPQEQRSPEIPVSGAEPSAEALRGAFRSALGGRQAVDLERVRVAACEYVRDLRVRGVSPEAVVVSVKDIVGYLVGFFPKSVINLPPRPRANYTREREGA